MDNQYQKTLTDIIIDLLRDEEKGLPTGYFKQFFYGDPILIPSSLLPCISVEQLTNEIKAGPTGMDEIDTTIAIKLMYNKREDFGKKDNEMLGVRKLEEFAMARDLTTNQFSPQSVMGILRKFFTLSTTENGYSVLDQTVVITNLGAVPRPKGVFTAEAQIKIKFHQLIKVSGRQ